MSQPLIPSLAYDGMSPVTSDGHRFWLSMLVIALLLATLSGCANSAATIDLRSSETPSSSRLVLDLPAQATAHVFSLSDPARLVVDIQGIDEQGVDRLLDAQRARKQQFISDVRSGRHGDKHRIVFDLAMAIEETNTRLPGKTPGMQRVVIDLNQKGRLPPVGTPLRGPRIKIAVDAGHGGRDPGAIGPAGTYEKDVVLSIAKHVARYLNSTPDFQAVLTRKDDTYIGLRRRTEIAREHGADAFISIHADAAPRVSAHGGSVYALSRRGASSETARWIAANQNSAITAEDALFLSGARDQMTRKTLLDLSIRRSISDSISLGESILRRMQGVMHLHKPNVERANFAVLRSPDTTSLLVETGFISNPEEEQRLLTKNHQAAVAKRIAEGVMAYYRKRPPQMWARSN